MQNNFCEVGDLVKIDYATLDGKPLKFVGLCTWTCGYKYTFLTNRGEETWVRGDLELVAEVINEGR